MLQIFEVLIAETASLCANFYSGNYSEEEVKAELRVLFERENVAYTEEHISSLYEHLQTLKNLQ